jgi:hypothetical protein
MLHLRNYISSLISWILCGCSAYLTHQNVKCVQASTLKRFKFTFTLKLYVLHCVHTSVFYTFTHANRGQRQSHQAIQRTALSLWLPNLVQKLCLSQWQLRQYLHCAFELRIKCVEYQTHLLVYSVILCWLELVSDNREENSVRDSARQNESWSEHLLQSSC